MHMNIEKYLHTLKNYVDSHVPNFGVGESVLTLLYEAYAECNKMDDGTIKEDFNKLYQIMNGMPLREMDKILYPVCTLCRNHQRAGFAHGIKVGVRLPNELNNEL